MKKIQFFYDDDLIALQLKINEWLAANEEKNIIETNLNSLGTPSKRAGVTTSEKYVFYILYSATTWENMLTEKTSEEILPNIERIAANVSEIDPKNTGEELLSRTQNKAKANNNAS